MPFIDIDESRLEYKRIPAAVGDRPELVLLHEGLGSVAMWKDFPEALAASTGHGVLVYSRRGHGRSTPAAGPHGVDYMHREALRTLPALLAALEVQAPILVGHSDGASIALIHAGAGFPVTALAVEAPHVFVEDLSVASIAEIGGVFEASDLPAKLGRYHDDPRGVFHAWNRIWLDPAFRGWNIEEYLPRIDCPILAIQGEDDQYGTMAQLESIAARAAGTVRKVGLNQCRHSPHVEQRAATLAAITDFIRDIREGAGDRSIERR